jgi:DNA-binding MarR family transcriptional regulator
MELDDDIVNAKRLMIMTTLFIFREMTEGELARTTGLSWGSLSTHLKRLESKGYVERRKRITSKGVRTVVKITERGYEKYREEVKKLNELLKGVRD